MMTIYPWAALGRPLSPDEQAIAERLQADTAFRRQLMRMRRDGLGYFTPACGMDQPAAVDSVLRCAFDSARRVHPDAAELLKRAGLLDQWAADHARPE